MRVCIIAPTGMLGSGVYRALKDVHELVLVVRTTRKLKLLDQAYGGIINHRVIPFDFERILDDFRIGFSTSPTSPQLRDLITKIGDVTAVINCAGVINRFAAKDPAMTMFLNGGIPHILSKVFGDKLIHITTDCVFDGLSGAPYTERSEKNPTDLYGLSKMLGEPAERSLVLRTSIIGPELENGVSLLDWFRQQVGGEVRGFTDHLWNGITTLEFGNICNRIISSRPAFPATGLFHIFSTPISKFDMLVKFKEKYAVKTEIIPTETAGVDRRLGTVLEVCSQLHIPSFDDMLKQL